MILPPSQLTQLIEAVKATVYNGRHSVKPSMRLSNSQAWAFIVLFGSLLCQPLSILGAEEVQGLSEAQLQALANLPEEQIDIGRVALILASEAYPGLDIPRYSAQLDAMVADIRRLTGSSHDPDYRIRAMNTYLYLDTGFHYDQDDQNAKQPKNRFLNGILETKAGSCVTLPLLYQALAQRLGYPVYPVAAPQHLFLRYVDRRQKMQNIEATSGGGFSTDDEYAEVLEISAQGIKSGTYLKTMTYRQLLGDLIAGNGYHWTTQRDYHRAVRYFQLALQLNPTNAETYAMLGQAYRDLAREAEQTRNTLAYLGNQSNAPFLRQVFSWQAEDYQQAGDAAFQQAKALGIAPPATDNYWIRQEQRAQARATRLAKKEANQ